MGVVTPATQQHIALEVSDTDRSIEFYRSFLGMKLTERHTAGEVAGIPVDLAFMRLGKRHHDLVLVHNPNKNYQKHPANPKDDVDGIPAFHHYAYECPDREFFQGVLEHAKEIGLEVIRGPVVHSPWDPRGDGSWGENESFYVLDPDNHRIEIFCNMAMIDDDGVFIDHDGNRIEEARAEEI